MKTQTIYILTLIIFSSCTAQNNDRTAAIELNNRGMEISEGKYDSTTTMQAITYFDKAINLDSTYLLPYHNKIGKLLQLSLFDEALTTIEAAQKYSDDLAWIVYKCNVYENSHQPEKAQHLYKYLFNIVSKLESKDHISYYLLLTKYFYGEQKAEDEMNRLFSENRLTEKERALMEELLTAPKESQAPFQ